MRGHHKAISYEQLPAFVEQLRQRDGVSAKALELLILSAARTGEIIGARWEEFNLTEATWTVPASRMKAGVEHVVPLSPRAIEILRALPRKGDHVFANGNDRAISNAAMLALMKGMGVDATPHGMRSGFQHMGKELQTNFAPETRQRGPCSYGGETRASLHPRQKPAHVRQAAQVDERVEPLSGGGRRRRRWENVVTLRA